MPASRSAWSFASAAWNRPRTRKLPRPLSYAAEIARVLALADTKEKFDALGMDPWITTPEQFAVVLRDDTAKYARIIKAANITIDP